MPASELPGVVLSVRGDALQMVAPDYVMLAAAIEASRESKEECSGSPPQRWIA